MTSAEKEQWMRRALESARRGWGLTHPNPMVGCVIVENGEAVAEGFHAGAGLEHAETAALRQLGRKPSADAVLFVTLEPCSTHGRTGPCTEALLEAGIRRVVVGAVDPNPVHRGAGLERLRQGGASVESGVLEEECRDLNLIFNHWITGGAPLFAGKVATTSDGKIACRTGQSKWITGESAREDVMRWRKLFPAIAVGANTALEDRPRLTSRLPEGEWCPVRFVFDGLLRLAHRKELPGLLTDEFRERSIVVTTEHAGTGYVRRLVGEGVKIWCLPSPSPQVPFGEFRRRCAGEGITGVYFEGGSRLLSGMIRERQLDYLFAYRAPLFFADDKARPVFCGMRTEKIEQGIRLADVRHQTFGDDQLMRGRVVYPEKMDVDEVVFSQLQRS